jgi:hypothetical protein
MQFFVLMLAVAPVFKPQVDTLLNFNSLRCQVEQLTSGRSLMNVVFLIYREHTIS